MRRRGKIAAIMSIGCIGCCAIPFILVIATGGSIAAAVTSKGLLEAAAVLVGLACIVAFIVYRRRKPSCTSCRLHGCSCGKNRKKDVFTEAAVR